MATPTFIRKERRALARAIENANFDIDHYTKIVSSGRDSHRLETISYLRSHRLDLRAKRLGWLLRLPGSVLRQSLSNRPLARF